MTATPTYTVSSTPTWSPVIVPTLEPIGASPDVVKLLPFPNPQSGAFVGVAFNLSAPADSIELRLYTHAMVLVGSYQRTGYFPKGWSNVKFEAPSMASGLYFAHLSASGGATKGQPSGPVKLMWLP
jgi:hypothetical protein